MLSKTWGLQSLLMRNASTMLGWAMLRDPKQCSLRAASLASCLSRNRQPEKDEQMTASKNFTVSDASINVVFKAEAAIADLKGQNRDNNEGC